MSPGIKAMIIDDEPGCIDNLKYHLSAYCPGICVLATGARLSDVEEQLHQVDILFLDIELFNQNVFDILKEWPQLKCRIVFVTAYSDYAVHAFKADALDYILKPLSRQDIEACYQKILRWMASTEQAAGPLLPEPVTDRAATLALRQGEKIFVVKTADVLYLEACGLYTKVYFLYRGSRHEILLSKMLSRLETEYPKDYFFRVHKSFIINIHNLNSINRHGHMNIEMISGDIIPVARRRMNEFMHYVQIKGVNC